MTRLSNQEKSARRYESLTKIAELFAETNEQFKETCWEEKEDKYMVTWRKLETFIKRKFEAGEKIKIVVESAGVD
jgi:hypothetical protein